MMGNRLAGKNSVVTGAGNGIGREIALALAGEGANVVVNDVGATVDGVGGGGGTPADEVVSLIKERGGMAVPSYDSVSEFDTAGKIIQTCIDAFGRIDILVNVAGILRDRMCFNMSFEEWDAVIKVHLYGTFNTCRHAVALMRKQGYGRIINTTSAAWVSTVGHANYGAAKGGIVSLTRAMANEVGRSGVTVNALAPHAATRMTMSEERKEGQRKRFEAGLITRERYERDVNMPGPEFVPPVVLYLASDYAADINGTVFAAGGPKVAIYTEPKEIRGIYRDVKRGPWTLDELIELMPTTVLAGYVNPAPKETSEDKK
ncbi:SDR family NAD(P)-dependent oxidoreductase [Chloroflexota bacterium]